MDPEELLDEQPEETEVLPVGQSEWPGAEPKQAAFLTALVTCGGQWAKAARAAKIARSTPYRWHETDDNFRQLYDRAMSQANRVLEDAARKRSIDGVRKGVYYMGQKVATETIYSDGLTQFLLRGAFPEKYRERTEVTGKVDHEHRWSGTMEELLATYRQIQQKTETQTDGSQRSS